MKKFSLLSCLSLLFSLMVHSQCQFTLGDNWLNLVTCNGTASVSGTGTIQYWSSGGGWSPCPGSSITVQLQRYNSPSWVTIQTDVLNTGFGSDTYSFTGLTAGEWRIVGIPSVGGTCAAGGCSGTLTKPSKTVTVNQPPTASFKADGLTVNPTTYTNVYGCSASTAQMTNITWGGTNNTYAWKVEVIKVSPAGSASTSWNTGTPPSTYDLRGFIAANFAAIPGQYTVKLWVKNICNVVGVAYEGKVQINNVPVTCVQLANNSSTGCNPAFYVNLGSSGTPTGTCPGDPKITASCSNGQWVGGFWNLVVWEFDLSNNFIQTVVSTGNQTLTNTSDISCLSLNFWSSPQAYFFTNPGNRKYVVYFTTGNSCGSSVAGGYFIDNTGACKTDGEATDVIDLEMIDASLLVFPNPANGELNVNWQYNSNYTQAASVKMYSIDGQEVNPSVLSSGPDNMKLDVTGLSKGIYTLELNDGSKQVKRVIIE